MLAGKIRENFRAWVPFAVLATVLTWFAHLAIQQDMRMGANDPQIQMAEDAAAGLSSGQSPTYVVPTADVDAAKSLAPFLVVYDDNGTPLAASGHLDGKAPMLPSGVFDWVRKHGEDRVSWQPRPGVRMAAVVTRYEGPRSGFVLAGRSLREVEKREAMLVWQTLMGWIAALVLTLAALIVMRA